MKAIWLDHGIITQHCGKRGLLQRLRVVPRKLRCHARTSRRPEHRRRRFYLAKHPADLGQPLHRVHEQQHRHRAEKRQERPTDIMAGLCRSIIENVFTKVIRVSNLDTPGRPHRGAGRHVPQRRRAACLRAVCRPRGYPRTVPWRSWAPSACALIATRKTAWRENAAAPHRAASVPLSTFTLRASEANAHLPLLRQPLQPHPSSRFPTALPAITGNRCTEGESRRRALR